MGSRPRILIISLGLVACGAVVGAACATVAVIAALIVHPPSEAVFVFEWSPLLQRAAVLGVAIGAVSAPLMAFGMLRRVPLGRAILVTAIGAIVGGVIGELIKPLNHYDWDLSPSGIIPGVLLGSIIAGIALRYAVGSARTSLSRGASA